MNAFTFVQIKRMPLLFYNIFLVLFKVGVRIYSIWSHKAKKWLSGRKNIFETIKLKMQDSRSGIIWFHCASLGEFEQGRPLIEKIKSQMPNFKLLITFFSPSGFEVRKDYVRADLIFYLPMDSKRNAQRFLDLIHPSLVLFIKYDYWYYYLEEIKKRKINCLLVSAVFRKDQPFFKWYGSLHRKMLLNFTAIFVQDDESKKLLRIINIQNCIVSGDTRFDTVIQIAENFEPIPIVENFISNQKCIVAGSTWHEDEKVLQKVFTELAGHNLKLIIAPHEIDPANLNELKRLFPASLRFSQITPYPPAASDTLIIDNFGLLSRVYKYAYLTYVGGGFTKDGVHNVLEAAVYGKPVVFGKNYEKYKEASDLVKCEGAKSFSNKDDLYQIFLTLINDEDDYRQKCRASENYVVENKGATETVLNYIEEKRLLTS